MAELTFSALSYRTGAYGNNGIPFADGYLDYFTLLQERDGGIGGESIRVIECETAYNTEKGVECYEATKGEGVLSYSPLSTGISTVFIMVLLAWLVQRIIFKHLVGQEPIFGERLFSAAKAPLSSSIRG